MKKYYVALTLLICSVAFAVTQQNAITFKKTVTVNGATDLDSTLNVDGAATMVSTLNGQGAVDLDSTLNVDGHSTLATGQVGSGSIDASSLFDTFSTAKGTRPAPSMTEAQRDAISSPVAGLLIFNTDTGKYNYYDGAEWKDVGSGSGAGGVTYFADFEADTIANVTTYDDGAVAAPVDGTGGTTATVSVTSETSAPLSLDASYKLSKSAADGQGEGFALTSDALSFLETTGGQTIQVKFNYKTSANYATDDYKIFIYRVGSNTLEACSGQQVSGSFSNGLLAAPNGGVFGCAFTASATDTSFRLIWHVATTNASAYDLHVDRISAGPDKSISVPIVTEWESYTPTFTGFGTVSSSSIQWRRVGSNMEIRGRFVDGTNTATEARMTLPSSLAASGDIDTLEIVGHRIVTSNGARTLYLTAEPSTSYLTFTEQQTSGNALTKLNGDALLGSTHSIWASVPIEGWDSGALMSTTQIDYRSARVLLSSAGTPAIGATETKLTFDTVVVDDMGLYSGGTFTAPVTGDYDISGMLQTDTESWSVGHLFALIAYVDGVSHKYVGLNRVVAAGTTFLSISISATVHLEAGQTLDLYTRSSVTSTILGGAPTNHVSISLRPDFSTFGVYGVHEYVETEITALASTASAGTWTAVSGSTLPLTPGTWILGYQVTAGVENVQSTLNTCYGGIRIVDGSGIMVEGSEALFGGVYPADSNIYHSQHREVEITITAAGDYSLEIINQDANTAAITQILADSAASIDNFNRIYARRIK